MEAFEKWRKQQEKLRVEVGFDYANEEGWRAALEWALSQEIKKPLLGGNYHKYIDSIALRNELEED